MCAILLSTALPLNAQISIAEQAHAQRYQDLITRNVPTIQMPAIDLNQLAQEDAAEEADGLPPRFGKRFEVNLNPNEQGRWDNVPHGGRVWRLAIESPGALSLNLTFDDFFLPKGARLFVFNEDFSQILGAFSAANNKADGKFATSLIFDEKIIIGYYEPRGTIGQGRLNINGVVHGYREIPTPELNKSEFNLRPPSALSCFLDTACPEGDPWRDQIKSVAMVVVDNGTRWCSGALVANTSGNQRLLFLTANNCLNVGFDTFDSESDSLVSDWVFHWNYETSTCDGSIPSLSTTNSTTGAFVIANSSPTTTGIRFSDFALLELIESPIAAGYDVFFAGWDASGDTPLGATSIHHPNGYPKKLAIENNPLDSVATNEVPGTVLGTGTFITHWEVDDWNGGALEGSSKGAPLFDNASGRIVGQYTSGNAVCDTLVNPPADNGLKDYFGRFSYSWDTNPTITRQLKHWLDPNNTEALVVDGYYQTNSCSNPQVVTCDDTYLDNTNNGQNIFEDYGFPQNYLGKEIIHSFTPNTDGVSVVELRNLTANLDLFLLNDCNPNNVIASSTNLGTNIESISVPLKAGETYFILVDAISSTASSSYTLTTGCIDPCLSPLEINCGEVFSSSTEGTKDYYSTHGMSGAGWTGGEAVFEFTTTGGQTTIDLTGLNVDLDLFLLDDCDPVNNEIARSTLIGLADESISINLSAGDYIIMVDGFNGSAGSYTLTLNCPTEGTCDEPVGATGDLMYTGNTAINGANNINQYDIFGGYGGNEIVYSYTPDENGPFDISLTNLTGDLDIFVLEASCDPINALIASSTQSNLDDEFISVDLTSGVTYFIVVDALTGISGSFNLFIETPTACDLPPQLDCSPLGNVFVFGVSGSTIAADNDYLFHGGNTTDEYRGGEAVYQFTTEAGSVEIELTSLANNLDLFLLEVCDSVQNEIARSDFGGKSNEIITTTLSAGTYFIMIDGFEDAESNFSLTLRCNRPPILVRTKMFLEGAYDSNDAKMSDKLRPQLSLSEPFTALGFNHIGGGGGESINPMILSTTGDDAIMDWVFVELRDSGDPDFVLATRSALLQRDGDIVDLDGDSPLEFPEIRDAYYVAVKMRNHLGVMTEMPVSLGYD
ncbi:MAG: PPC domain-containing protein [Bacteroidota bacterium]